MIKIKIRKLILSLRFCKGKKELLIALLNILLKLTLGYLGLLRTGIETVRFPNKPRVVYYEFYGTLLRFIHVPNTDYLFLTNPYINEFEMKVIFAYLSRASDLIVDVGAHVGSYTVIGSIFCKKEGTVIAIEPITDNFNILKFNLRLNGVEWKTIVIKTAVTGREEADYLALRYNPTESGRASKSGAGTKTTLVPAVPLQRILVSHYRKGLLLIKLDIEDMTAETLSSLWFIPFPTIIILEAWPDLLSRILKDLRRLGLRFVLVFDYGHLKMLVSTNDERIFHKISCLIQMLWGLRPLSLNDSPTPS